MRKYTQLCLVVITVVSVIVLLMYRNEYKQLKYVLDVVNFIGRKDEIALIRLENQTNVYQQSSFVFNYPLPIWQRIGNGFHAYSSFWIRPNGLRAGGELITIAIGLKHSIVSFRCDLNYPDRRVQKGKFMFVREDANVTANDVGGGVVEPFIVYKFVCKVQKDYGTPDQITFTDIKTKSRHRVRVRNLKRKDVNEMLTMSLCVDLLPHNQTHSDPFYTDFNLQQFFVHHQLLGIDEFLVYDYDVISPPLKQTLFSHGIKLNIFPFNFPFEMGQRNKTRKIIELDCLLRTSNSVKYTMIVTPRDYIYTNGYIGSTPQPLLQMLRSPLYGKDVKLEVATNAICAHKMKKIMADNLLLSANARIDTPAMLYKTNAIFMGNNNVATSHEVGAARINKSLIFSNHYSDCESAEGERVDESLVEWRAGLPIDFRRFVDEIAVQENSLLRVVAH